MNHLCWYYMKNLPRCTPVILVYSASSIPEIAHVHGGLKLTPKNGKVSRQFCLHYLLHVTDLRTGEALGENKEGEICVRGPQVMKGYLNNPKATSEAIDSDGWLRTGDIGYYDSDQYFHVVDRCKELIKYKGYQVAPGELEATLIAHPKIQDAAVIGIPDEECGELPKGFVVANDVSKEEIHSHLEDNVAPYKKLRGGIEFVDEIPKSLSGKILRRVLKEQELSK